MIKHKFIFIWFAIYELIFLTFLKYCLHIWFSLRCLSWNLNHRQLSNKPNFLPGFSSLFLFFCGIPRNLIEYHLVLPHTHLIMMKQFYGEFFLTNNKILMKSSLLLNNSSNISIQVCHTHAKKKGKKGKKNQKKRKKSQEKKQQE